MAPLDWHRLMQMQVNDLAEDETRAEDLYDVLGEVKYFNTNKLIKNL